MYWLFLKFWILNNANISYVNLNFELKSYKETKINLVKHFEISLYFKLLNRGRYFRLTHQQLTIYWKYKYLICIKYRISQILTGKLCELAQVVVWNWKYVLSFIKLELLRIFPETISLCFDIAILILPLYMSTWKTFVFMVV